jgi:hypothetical protein
MCKRVNHHLHTSLREHESPSSLCRPQENENGAEHVVTPVCPITRYNGKDLITDYEFDAMPLEGGESGQKCSGLMD